KWAARLELLQNFDQRRHIVGQFAFEAKLGAGDWVFEAEHSRMQRLARKRGDGGRGFLRVRTFRFEGALLAVKRIADQRAAQMREVCTNLMRAAGVQPALQQSRRRAANRGAAL